jgi:hypothetical protein
MRQPGPARRTRLRGAGRDLEQCPDWCSDHLDLDLEAERLVQHRDGPWTSTATHEDAAGSELLWLRTAPYEDDEQAHDHRVVLVVPLDSRGETWLDAQEARTLAEHLLAAARTLEAPPAAPGASLAGPSAGAL